MKKKNYILTLILLICLVSPVIGITENGVATSLGWVRVPNNTNFCGGYYIEPLLDFSKYGLVAENDSRITANSASIYSQGRSVLRGDVVVEQPNKRSEADLAYIYRDVKTEKITRIDMIGNVRIREPGKLLLAKRAQIELDKKSGSIENATYRFSRSNRTSHHHAIRELYGVNGWGQASSMEQLREGYYVLHQATYSTCPPTLMDWQVKAHKIIIDDNNNQGKVYHGIFLVRDVPVMYVPYYSFSLRDQRKTGFLFGSANYTDNSGFETIIPFYWNIAPNYDATITGHDYSKRGFMMQSEFRYLTPRSYGGITGNILPHDNVFQQFRSDLDQQGINISGLGDSDRAFLHWENFTAFNTHWTNSVNFNYVSDDYYFQDFTNNIANTWRSQLVQQADINYFDEHWAFLGRAQNYQTLHPVNSIGVSDVYSRLPQLQLDGNYAQWKNLSDLRLKTEIDYFRWPNSFQPSGGRYLIYPGFSVPLTAQYGYVKPRLDLHSSAYTLYDQTPTLNTNSTRVLPLVSVDSGIYLDRQFSLFNSDYTQTLEPRLFYLWVPFSDQNNLPLFDTGLYNFTFSQLFRTNRFSGEDRIGDANQVSLALSTRILDANSAFEKFKFGIGEVIYFQDRKVSYCSNSNIDTLCTNPINNISYTSPTSTFSPIVATADYRFNNLWSLTSDIAVSVQDESSPINNGHLGLRYAKSNRQIIKFQYDYQSNVLSTDQFNRTTVAGLNQIGAATAWPLTQHWSFLSALSYNLAFKHLQTSFVGMQYESCCWAFRLLGAKTLTSFENQREQADFNNGLYLQVQLKGVATVGSNDANAILASNIPGFDVNFN